MEFPGGAEWRSYLRNRIEKASCMLVFLSVRSVKSKWVVEEISLAQELGKRFLSIRLDHSKAPEQSERILSAYQMLDSEATDFREQVGLGMRLLLPGEALLSTAATPPSRAVSVCTRPMTHRIISMLLKPFPWRWRARGSVSER